VFALDVVFTAIGFIVGGTVGLTGVGGGALMTPILLLLGISPALAVGTDLLYAALTKSGAVWIHHRNRTIQWRLVLLLSLGSIPAAALSVWLLRDLVSDTAGLNRVIVGTLSVSLILTAIVLLLRGRLHSFGSRHALPLVRRLHGPWRARTTIAGGFLISLALTSPTPYLWRWLPDLDIFTSATWTSACLEVCCWVHCLEYISEAESVYNCLTVCCGRFWDPCCW
jgi:uncharacterized membrane protein YfcA